MAQRFGLKIKTRLSFDELDNVVGQYAQGGYAISIGGLEDTGGVRKKIMIIFFDKAEDRDRLKHLFTVRASKKPPMVADNAPAIAPQAKTA